MSAVTTLNGKNCIQEAAIRPQNVEEKALAFFQRADLNESQPNFIGWRYSDDTAIRQWKSEESASAFFQRADLSDTLQGIWDSVKHLPISTVLKLLKSAALVAAAVLLVHGISITGLLALAGAIAGLLLAAISNVLSWLIYIPMYAVSTSDFALCIVLSIGLTWLGGVSPFFALVFSPLILFGSRMLEHSQWAQQSVSTISHSIADIIERADLGTGIRKAAADITGFIGSLNPR